MRGKCKYSSATRPIWFLEVQTYSHPNKSAQLKIIFLFLNQNIFKRIRAPKTHVKTGRNQFLRSN